MTDFNARAREIARYWDPGSPGEMASQISAALKAAYNEGLEESAADFDERHCDCIKYAACGTWQDAAEALRSKKVP